VKRPNDLGSDQKGQEGSFTLFRRPAWASRSSIASISPRRRQLSRSPPFRSACARGRRRSAPPHFHVADKSGKAIGYPATHLERLLPYLSFVISDNEAYVNLLTNTFVGAPAMEKAPRMGEWAAAKMLTLRMDPTKREILDLAGDLQLTKAG
jgi:hypothetical protein